MGQKLSYLKSAGEFYDSEAYNSVARQRANCPTEDLFTFLKNKGVNKNQVAKTSVDYSKNPEVLTVLVKDEDFSQVSLLLNGTTWGNRPVQVLRVGTSDR